MLDELNHIIDGVAKEMTSAPVDANLARRVAARIARGDVPRRSVWLRPVLLAPLAAVCAIVGVVFVARDKPSVMPAPPPIVAVAPQPTPVQQGERARESRTARAAMRRPRVAPPPAVQEVDLTPIVVDRVDVTPIVQAEQIEIDPIAIARIEIPPMP